MLQSGAECGPRAALLPAEPTQLKDRTPAHLQGCLWPRSEDGRRWHEGGCAPVDAPATAQTRGMKETREDTVCISESNK